MAIDSTEFKEAMSEYLAESGGHTSAYSGQEIDDAVGSVAALTEKNLVTTESMTAAIEAAVEDIEAIVGDIDAALDSVNGEGV